MPKPPSPIRTVLARQICRQWGLDPEESVLHAPHHNPGCLDLRQWVQSKNWERVVYNMDMLHSMQPQHGDTHTPSRNTDWPVSVSGASL